MLDTSLQNHNLSPQRLMDLMDAVGDVMTSLSETLKIVKVLPEEALIKIIKLSLMDSFPEELAKPLFDKLIESGMLVEEPEVKHGRPGLYSWMRK